MTETGSALHDCEYCEPKAWQSPSSMWNLWLRSLPLPTPLLDPRVRGDDSD